ncbi:HTH-type transcriptional regulator ImmR [compost metagenome]
MSTFGSRLRELRTNKKLSQKELANYFKISESAVGMYERDQREPSFELIERIADFFEVSTDYLLGRENEPKKLSFDDLDMRESENLFFFNRDGMSDEDIEKIKEYIELLRMKAKRYNEKHKE